MTRRGGIYVWRTRKPHAFIGLPIIGRHFAYGGETSSYERREREHRYGRRNEHGVLTTPPAPWSDLGARCYRLPTLFWRWKRARLIQEALLIRVLFCVYNHQHNMGNPRRIPIYRAREQRAARERQGTRVNTGRVLIRYTIHAFLLSCLAAGAWGAWVR